MINHIIDNDIEYIINNTKLVNDEYQFSVKEPLDNKYFISAKISFIDKSDKLVVDESNIRNIVYSLIEFACIVGAYIPISKKVLSRKRDLNE